MYQFFVDPGAISEKQVVITGKDVNHIKKRPAHEGRRGDRGQ